MIDCNSKRTSSNESEDELRQDIREIFDEGNKIKSTFYRGNTPKFKLEEENGQVKRFTATEVKEKEMEKLDIETRKKVEERQKKIENFISEKMNLVQYCIATLLMTGQWQSTDDIINFLEKMSLKKYNSGSTTNALRHLFLSSFGKKFLSRKRQGSLHYKIKAPELSLLDVDKSYKLFLGRITWQEAIKGIPELETLFNISRDENSNHPKQEEQEGDKQKESEILDEGSTSRVENDSTQVYYPLIDEERIDELTNHLNQALKIARKIKGFTFEFEIKSETPE